MGDSGLSNSGFFKSQELFRSHCEKYNEFVKKEIDKKENKKSKNCFLHIFNFILKMCKKQ